MESAQQRITLLGCGCMGKSSIVARFLRNESIHGIPTTIVVEFGFKSVHIGGKEVKLQIWDTAGHERHRSMIKPYLKGIHGIMVVYDVTDMSSFLEIRTIWMEFIRENVPSDTVVMIVGNKTDLVERRVVSEVMGRELAEDCGALFTEVSALTGNNVNKAFLDLAKGIETRAGDTQAPRVISKRTCGNCNGPFTNPKLLQCFHVYCKKCVDQMVVQDDDGESLITCPACLYTTPLPLNGVSSLVTASHITQHNAIDECN